MLNQTTSARNARIEQLRITIEQNRGALAQMRAQEAILVRQRVDLESEQENDARWPELDTNEGQLETLRNQIALREQIIANDQRELDEAILTNRSYALGAQLARERHNARTSGLAARQAPAAPPPALRRLDLS